MLRLQVRKARLAIAIAGLLLTLFPDMSHSTTHDARLSIGWRDLVPAMQSPGPATARALSLELEGKTVQISGYLLPVDREGDLVYEFMLVPWAGACSHMPGPPVNQAVLVTPAEPYRMSMIYEPVSVAGNLRTGLSLSQLFILDGVTTLESGYSISRAVIVPATPGAVSKAATAQTPWKFLNK